MKRYFRNLNSDYCTKFGEITVFDGTTTIGIYWDRQPRVHTCWQYTLADIEAYLKNEEWIEIKKPDWYND